MSGFACSSLLVSLLLTGSPEAPPTPAARSSKAPPTPAVRSSKAPPTPAVRSPEAPTVIGKRVEPAALTDCLGADAVAGWKQSRASVVVFLGTECPLAARYTARLGELSEKYRGQGVRFFGIDSNQQDSLAAISHFAQLNHVPFPVCKDAGNKVADLLGAVRTPEAFVIDSTGVVRYGGLIDDQFGIGYAHNKAKRTYVEDALANILAGRSVRTPSTPSIGCRIGRVNRRPPKGDVTYSNQVARIFRNNCVQCHRPGEVAPFALTSYADAAAWSETIREVIDQNRMPPWSANPSHGKFVNDARLSDKDKQLVRDWIDNGMPEGDRSQLPPKPEFLDGWRISKPDLVIKMPEPFTVPASGVVDYKYFTVDPGFTHDVWIRGGEARPGNRSVVHHLLLFYVPPEQAGPRPEDALFNAVAAFAPGMPAATAVEGYAGRIPAGSRLVFQLHYTPNGTEQVDQSEVGLLLADPKTVRHEVSVGGIFNWQFQIPPGVPDYRVDAQEQLQEDRLIYELSPHMHLRGKSFSFTALYPDGRKEVLLDVPRYDFNWQNVYRLAEPKVLPAGTQIDCRAAFDNSENNLLNPDPSSEVHWGDQTWDEMMIGTYDFSPAEQDFSLGPPRVSQASDGSYHVDFRYRPPGPALTVFLAGTFNDWKPTAHAMSGPDKDGYFTTTLPLPIGRYEYKFVVDGKTWKTDPGNMSRTQVYRNGVIVVGDLHPPVLTRTPEGKYAAAFRFHPNQSCKTVAVAGTFNHWKPTGHELHGPDSEGWYTTTVELPEGRHEYKFVIDGKTQVSDPGNPVEWGKKKSSVLWARP